MAAGDNVIAPERTLVTTRVFDAPRQRVYKAWTDPKQLALWFPPEGFTAPRCELDVRVGGAMRIDMKGPEGEPFNGQIYPGKGVYREVIPNERLVFTMVPEIDGKKMPSVLMTVEFEDQAGKTKLTILRPLLGVWRHEIDSYVRERTLQFREDKTNAQLNSSRNKIRHAVLPGIEKTFGRDVSKAIWRAAMIWADEELFLDAMTPGTELRLDVAELRQLAIPLQRRTIVRWLRRNRVANVGFDLVEKVRALVDPSSSISKVNVPGDRHIRRRSKKIFLQD